MRVGEIRDMVLTIKAKDCPTWAKPISLTDWLQGWTRLNRSRRPTMAKPTREVRFPKFYATYMASLEWSMFRGAVLILARFKCARCGGEAGDVHHKTYDRLGNERLDDVEPICRKCHISHHGGPMAGNMKYALKQQQGHSAAREGAA